MMEFLNVDFMNMTLGIVNFGQNLWDNLFKDNIKWIIACIAGFLFAQTFFKRNWMGMIAVAFIGAFAFYFADDPTRLQAVGASIANAVGLGGK